MTMTDDAEKLHRLRTVAKQVNSNLKERRPLDRSVAELEKAFGDFFGLEDTDADD